MTSLAVLVSAAILQAWGSGLVGNDVVAFVVEKTGADVEQVEHVLAEMSNTLMD
jgi:hypothetical protein